MTPEEIVVKDQLKLLLVKKVTMAAALMVIQEKPQTMILVESAGVNQQNTVVVATE